MKLVHLEEFNAWILSIFLFELRMLAVCLALLPFYPSVLCNVLFSLLALSTFLPISPFHVAAGRIRIVQLMIDGRAYCVRVYGSYPIDYSVDYVAEYSTTHFTSFRFFSLTTNVMKAA